jgi:hypothetical protein
MVYIAPNWNSEEAKKGDYWRGFYELIKDSDPVSPNDIHNIILKYYSVRIKHIKKPSEIKKTRHIDWDFYLLELGCSLFERNSTVLSELILSYISKRNKPALLPSEFKVYSPFRIWKSECQMFSSHEFINVLKTSLTADEWKISEKILGHTVIPMLNRLTELLHDIETFKDIAIKAWGNSQDEAPLQKPLTGLEFELINSYFMPPLNSVKPFCKSKNNKFDLSTFELKTDAQWKPKIKKVAGENYILSNALGIPISAILNNAIKEFLDEVIYFNNFVANKGTIQCIECGCLVPREFYGHGQKYCTPQCKKRASQRRYNKRKKTKK